MIQGCVIHDHQLHNLVHNHQLHDIVRDIHVFHILPDFRVFQNLLHDFYVFYVFITRPSCISCIIRHLCISYITRPS